MDRETKKFQAAIEKVEAKARDLAKMLGAMDQRYEMSPAQTKALRSAQSGLSFFRQCDLGELRLAAGMKII
jgi:hypothetical protein